MELENIILSEVSQAQKAKGHYYVHVELYTEHVPKVGT
jgi:hypothetical protein